MGIPARYSLSANRIDRFPARIAKDGEQDRLLHSVLGALNCCVPLIKAALSAEWFSHFLAFLILRANVVV